MSEDDHSIRGPSGAHRWRRCPGSINAERGLPDNARREAAEGTVFHEYAAMALRFGLDPEDFPLGVVTEQDGYEIEYDEDMVRYMRAGLDWIRDEIEPGDIVLIERRVDISPWCGEGQFGTADVIIIKALKRRIINFDWKYGKGIPVSPVKNDQMYLYNLGGWNDYAEPIFNALGIRPEEIEVEFVIEQPRANGGGGSWTTTMAECLAEGEQIREDALATMNPHAVRVPGEKQCLFCKASGRCPEQDVYLLDVMGQKFEDIAEDIELGVGPAFERPEELSREVRSFVLLHWKTFKRWVDQIHAITVHDLKAGKDVPLLKAVAGKPGRRYYMPDYLPEASETLVELMGKDKAYETKLVSPAVAEKAVGKKVFAEKMKAYINQPPGKTILVSLDDARPAIQDFASKFEDMDDDSDNENGED